MSERFYTFEVTIRLAVDLDTSRPSEEALRENAIEVLECGGGDFRAVMIQANESEDAAFARKLLKARKEL